MAKITTSILRNGMPLHRIAMDGTRAVTLMVAFDAGARTERPEENGMAHFLEHLVFKGGEKYPNYRDVNEAASIAWMDLDEAIRLSETGEIAGAGSIIGLLKAAAILTRKRVN